MAGKTYLYQSSEMADFYVKYRPRYDDDVFETIVAFCREMPSAAFSLALDVGCGSGQSTLPLVRHFRQVIGLDVSPAQISKAPTDIPNLSFHLGPAEDLSFLDSGSVDLVTSAMALHWMDTQRFCPEVERVLRPGGALVVYGYGFPVLDEPEAQEIFDKLRDTVCNRWSMLRRMSDCLKNPFQHISLPFPGCRKCDNIKMERTWTLDEFMGFLMSSTPQYMESLENPRDSASLNFRERLQSVYQDETGRQRNMVVTFPVYMLMGQKPC